MIKAYDVIDAAVEGDFETYVRPDGKAIVKAASGVLLRITRPESETSLRLEVLGSDQDEHYSEAIMWGGKVNTKSVVLLNGTTAQDYLSEYLIDALRSGVVSRGAKARPSKKAADQRIAAAQETVKAEATIASIAAEEGVTTGEIYDLLYGWEATVVEAPAVVEVPAPRKARASA